jgi:energy-coupling factor transport system ATP-binding protein
VIEACGVTYRYDPRDEPAVEDVSLQVKPGEIISIVGPNGSGKSTMGRLVKALMLPTGGRVLVDELDTRERSLEVRRIVGMVFQNPNSQIVNSIVEQEVAFGPENLGLPTEEVRWRVGEALEAVGLQGREKAECHSLTMADKQRIALAAVIALHPRYLILDEPTAWIEPRARWRLFRAVLRWSTEQGAGVVLITHRMDEALLSRRMYGMLHGRVEVVDTPQSVLADEAMRTRLALDVPDTFALARELEAAGLPAVPGADIDQLADVLCQA